MDLKKYMDKVEKVGDGEGLGPDIVKVSAIPLTAMCIIVWEYPCPLFSVNLQKFMYQVCLLYAHHSAKSPDQKPSFVNHSSVIILETTARQRCQLHALSPCPTSRFETSEFTGW